MGIENNYLFFFLILISKTWDILVHGMCLHSGLGAAMFKNQNLGLEIIPKRYLGLSPGFGDCKHPVFHLFFTA